MAADIEPVILVDHRTRDAADIDGIAFDKGDGVSRLRQFVSGGEAGGTGPDDQGFNMHQRINPILATQRPKPPAKEMYLWAKKE